MGIAEFERGTIHKIEAPDEPREDLHRL